MNEFGIVISTLQFVLDLLKWLYDLNVHNILSSKICSFFNIPHKDYDNNKTQKLSNNKKKLLIRRRLKVVFFLAEKDNYGIKSILGSKLIFSLRKYEAEDSCIDNIYYWKACGYIEFDGNKIETMTVIKILREDELLESIIACKS